jgi:hypothetical protein
MQNEEWGLHRAAVANRAAPDANIGRDLICRTSE